jgi:hypothetical protein
VARADATIDCAGALLEPGVVSLQAVVGVGALNKTPAASSAGQRLLKAGAEMGVTEGVIGRLDGARVLIVVPQGFPASYTVAAKGDSGGIWVTADTHQPVAMHLGVRTIDGVAVALPIAAVLTALRLGIA